MKHPNIKLSLYSYHNSSFSPSSSSSDVFFTILIKIYLIIQVETKADHEHRQESTDLSILAHHLQSIHATKENRVASSIGLLLNIGLPHTSSAGCGIPDCVSMVVTESARHFSASWISGEELLLAACRRFYISWQCFNCPCNICKSNAPNFGYSVSRS